MTEASCGDGIMGSRRMVENRMHDLGTAIDRGWRCAYMPSGIGDRNSWVKYLRCHGSPPLGFILPQFGVHEIRASSA